MCECVGSNRNLVSQSLQSMPLTQYKKNMSRDIDRAVRKCVNIGSSLNVIERSKKIGLKTSQRLISSPDDIPMKEK